MTLLSQNYRNGNYCAFYVEEPFNQSNLGANQKPDFIYYNLLQAWKEKDNAFPFINSHDKTYNVRDDSDWDLTLKPRLHERLNKSKNIILFLSTITINSRALHEEIDYGINTCGLPIIVIYPQYKENSEIVENGSIKTEIQELWNRLAIFKNNMDKVPTLHIPMKKELIAKALNDKDLMVQTKIAKGRYFFR